VATHEAITVTTTTPIGFTLTKITERLVTDAFCTVEDADIRFLHTGDNPTSSVGHLIPKGTTFKVANFNHLRKFRMIGIGGIAKVSVSFNP